jgi:hypothetical protein
MLDLFLIGNISLNKPSNLSKPQFLMLQNEDINLAYFTALLRRSSVKKHMRGIFKLGKMYIFEDFLS